MEWGPFRPALHPRPWHRTTSNDRCLPESAAFGTLEKNRTPLRLSPADDRHPRYHCLIWDLFARSKISIQLLWLPLLALYSTCGRFSQNRKDCPRIMALGFCQHGRLCPISMARPLLEEGGDYCDLVNRSNELSRFESNSHPSVFFFWWSIAFMQLQPIEIQYISSGMLLSFRNEWQMMK